MFGGRECQQGTRNKLQNTKSDNFSGGQTPINGRKYFLSAVTMKHDVSMRLSEFAADRSSSDENTGHNGLAISHQNQGRLRFYSADVFF